MTLSRCITISTQMRQFSTLPKGYTKFCLCHLGTQPETQQTCCKLWILSALIFCKLSTSCSKSVEFIKLQQVCENQTCCNLIFADLLQVVETTYIKFLDKKTWQSTCIKPSLVQWPFAADVLSSSRSKRCERASWYWLHDTKVTSMQQTCVFLVV